MGGWMVVGLIGAFVVLLAVLAIPVGRRRGRRSGDGTSRDSVVESRRDTRAWRSVDGMRVDDSWRADRREGR